MDPSEGLSPQCAAGYHILCRAFRAGHCICRCHSHADTAKGPVVEIAIDGVATGPACAFPPAPAVADVEIGVTTETDPKGW